MKLRISIAMATFNGSEFIEELLHSLSRQTILPCELVVNDDCSMDDTVIILERLRDRLPFPVKVFINTERLGYRENFSAASARCSGDYIAFCDQDDIWCEDKIEKITRILERKPYLLVQHGFEAVGRFGEALPEQFDYPNSCDHPFAYVLGFTQVFHSCLLRFSELRSETADFNSSCESLAHDQWTFFLAYCGGSYYNIGSRLVKYRQHDRNVFGLVGHSSAIPRSTIGTVLRAVAYQHDSYIKEKRRSMRSMLARRVAYGLALKKVSSRAIEISLSIQDNCFPHASFEANLQRSVAAARYNDKRLKVYSCRRRSEALRAILKLSSMYCGNGVRGVKDLVLDVTYGVFAAEFNCD